MFLIWIRVPRTLNLNDFIQTLHKKIPFAIDLRSKDEGSKSGCLTYSGGFDARIFASNSLTQDVTKEVSISETLATFKNIVSKPMIMPNVYSITCGRHNNQTLVSLETGNVVAFEGENLNKAAFCLEGHFNKVLRSEFFEDNKSLVLTVSDDLSWALWNSKNTELVRKVALKQKPNYVESLPGQKVVVCDTSNKVSLFEIKG